MRDFLRTSPAVKAATVAGLVIVLLAVGIGANFWLTSYEVQRNNHTLCNIVNLVTAHPVPKPTNPTQNPSRAVNYEFYEAFVQVKNDYGC